MKTSAVIAEYNPFHKGHLWQLNEMKKNGASHIVVIMSPDFTQRGTPALFPKRVRAKAALMNGADLVIELPVCYAAAGAQRFAFGAVQTVCSMGCVDQLAFGAEDSDLALLESAASALDDTRVQQELRLEMSNGITFAKARENAVAKVFGNKVAAVLQTPNNILGVEYICQLQKADFINKPKPFAVARVGNAHDGAPKEGFASASHIRKLITDGSWDEAEKYLPSSAFKLYKQAEAEGLCADIHNGKRAILSALRRMSKEEMALLPDISEGIENRLYKAAHKACSIDELYELIKTKRYTLSRVRRLVTAAFLQLPAAIKDEAPPYIRVLGANKNGMELLSKMKQTASLPVSASLAKLMQLGGRAGDFAALENACADQYRLFTKTISPCGTDCTESAVFMK